MRESKGCISRGVIWSAYVRQWTGVAHRRQTPGGTAYETLSDSSA